MTALCGATCHPQDGDADDRAVSRGGLYARPMRVNAARSAPLRSGSDGTRTRDLRRDRAAVASEKYLQMLDFCAADVTSPSPFYAASERTNWLQTRIATRTAFSPVGQADALRWLARASK